MKRSVYDAAYGKRRLMEGTSTHTAKPITKPTGTTGKRRGGRLT